MNNSNNNNKDDEKNRKKKKGSNLLVLDDEHSPRMLLLLLLTVKLKLKSKVAKTKETIRMRNHHRRMETDYAGGILATSSFACQQRSMMEG